MENIDENSGKTQEMSTDSENKAEENSMNQEKSTEAESSEKSSEYSMVNLKTLKIRSVLKI